MSRFLWAAIYLLVLIFAAMQSYDRQVVQYSIVDFVALGDNSDAKVLEQAYVKKLSSRVYVAFGPLQGGYEELTEAVRPFAPRPWVSLAEQSEAIAKHAHLLRSPSTLNEETIQQALEQLYTPGVHPYLAHLSSDPLLLGSATFNSFLKPGSVAKSTQPEILQIQSNEGTFIAFQFEVDAIKSLELFVDTLESVAQNASTSVQYTGVPLFAKHTRESIVSAASVVSIVSLLVLAALLVYCYRAPPVIMLVLFTTITSALFAFATTVLIFGSIHVIALGFGASIIGLSADYSFHYFSASRQGALNRSFFRLLLVSALTSCAGYLALLFVPVPGIAQLAAFTVTGLLAAFLNVVLFYPRLRFRINETVRGGTVFEFFCGRSQSLTRYVLLSVLLVAGFLTAPKLLINDDVVTFNSVDQKLISNEKSIRELLAKNTDSVFVAAESPLAAVQKAKQYLDVVGANVSKQDPVYALLASLSKYQQNKDGVHAFLLNYKAALADYRKAVGLADTVAYENTSLDGALTDLLGVLPVVDYVEGRGDARAILLHRPKGEFTAHETLVPENISLFAPAKDASLYIAKVHRYLRQALPLCVAFIAIVLWVFYKSFLRMLRGIVPLVCGAAVLTAVLFWSAQAVTIFHTLSLFIILGLGVDYAVFLHSDFGSTQEKKYAREATLLSLLSTVASLGLLALVPNPAIHYFGLSIVVGISTMYAAHLCLLEGT